MSEENKTTAFPTESIKKQDQNLPGLDAKMDPKPIFTRLEEWDLETGKPTLVEYKGVGKLKGRAVLFTGGDSGIGRAASLMMAREGANLTIVHLPQEERDAQEVKEQIESESDGKQKCLLLAYDLTEESNCKKAVEEHIKTFGRLDCLVNNSARQVLCPNIEDIDLKNVELTYRLNILAMFAMAKYAVPHMKRGSSIINSTSVAAYMGNPELVDYSSTKGAITTFTKSLGLQLAPKGIRVNGVAPGIIYTPLQPASNDAETMEAIGVGEAPIGRPGQPSELGPTYVFLASPESSYITSSVIHVTGGIEVYG